MGAAAARWPRLEIVVNTCPFDFILDFFVEIRSGPEGGEDIAVILELMKKEAWWDENKG